ncbi:MAG: hypothetical protein JRG91_06235 [Deltaproteobacteria bacterium]|nr:hypothetical protein [Deltaproteobacteria bacterium]
MPVKKKKKFSRKELKKPDEFISKSAEFSELMVVHKRKILIGVAVAVGLLVAGSAYYVFNEERALTSSQGMMEALDVLSRPVKTVQLFSGSSEGEDEESFASLHEKDEATQKAFHEAVEKASSAPVKRMAILGEAQALLGLGKYEEAAGAYQLFIDSPEGAETFLFLAYEGLGLALEGQGKLDEATKQFKTLGGVGDGKYEPLALYHQARILESQEKKAEAKDVYASLAKRINEAPKMTPMLGYLQERIAGKEGVPETAGFKPPSGEPGMLMGPGGQMLPTGGGPGGGGMDLDPEQLQKLREALQKLQQEEAGAGPPPPGPPPPSEGAAQGGDQTQ